MEKKEKQYGHAIYIIADEPYREIAYDVEVPYIPNFYRNTLVCYSYSKCLSIPVSVWDILSCHRRSMNLIRLKRLFPGAARVLSYVNTPTMFQLLMKKCHEDVADMSIYRKNRDLLYGALTDLGFSCVKPDGAFYLFPKSLEPDDYAFCKKAVEHNLILVPGTEFGCPRMSASRIVSQRSRSNELCRHLRLLPRSIKTKAAIQHIMSGRG